MLKQKYRFHGHGSLRYLHRNGKTIRSRSLSIRFTSNPRRQHNRCAVIITRKVVKSAPKRNRIRRRVYEVLRLEWGHVAPAHDISINVHDPNCSDMPYQELSAYIIDILRRAGLWRPPSD